MRDRRLAAIRAVEQAQVLWDELPSDVRAVTDWAEYITDAAIAALIERERDFDATGYPFGDLPAAMRDFDAAGYPFGDLPAAMWKDQGYE